MWHFVSDQISAQLNQDFICDDIRQVKGGDTHLSFKVSDGRSRFFVKVNDAEKLPQLEAEADGLTHLLAANVIRVPKVICTGTVSGKAFLVLEHLRLQSDSQQNWRLLGEKLAELHQHNGQEMYGWQSDNYIGPTPQLNPWHKKWNLFFAEQRIGFLLTLLAEKRILVTPIDDIVTAVANLLAGHQPHPSTLHGDLWSGNVSFSGGMPVFFDPAFYIGDRETDLAMTELFSPFPKDFYLGYQDTWALPPEYEYRKPVYQLYHVLNHALLFGGHYIESANAILKNLEP